MKATITKKALLLSLLLLVTGSAWAEWQKVAETDETIFYIDPTTIRKNGNMRLVWELRDFKRLRWDLASSFRVRLRYDCNDERVQVLSGTLHSASMADGFVLKEVKGDNSWSDIRPENPLSAALAIVCAD